MYDPFLQPEQQTEDLLALTESWFHLLSKQPMDMIRNISSQPFPELHCGALRIFTVSHHLFLRSISGSLCYCDHKYLLLSMCACVPGYCHSALGSEVNGQHSQFHGVCFGPFNGPVKRGQRCEVWAGGIACVFVHGGAHSGQPALHQSEGLSERGTLLRFSCGLSKHRRSWVNHALKGASVDFYFLM